MISDRYHAKGAAGLRSLVAALKRGGHLALMADQRFNEGIALPAFIEGVGLYKELVSLLVADGR